MQLQVPASPVHYFTVGGGYWKKTCWSIEVYGASLAMNAFQVDLSSSCRTALLEGKPMLDSTTTPPVQSVDHYVGWSYYKVSAVAENAMSGERLFHSSGHTEMILKPKRSRPYFEHSDKALIIVQCRPLLQFLSRNQRISKRLVDTL